MDASYISLEKLFNSLSIGTFLETIDISGKYVDMYIHIYVYEWFKVLCMYVYVCNILGIYVRLFYAYVHNYVYLYMCIFKVSGN